MESEQAPVEDWPESIGSCVVQYPDIPAIAAWAQQMITAGHSVKVDRSPTLSGYVEGLAW